MHACLTIHGIRETDVKSTPSVQDFEHVFDTTISYLEKTNPSSRSRSDMKIEISLAIVDDKRMAYLNNKFNSVHVSTDVLSFGLYEGSDEYNKPAHIGEIAINNDLILKQAREEHHSQQYEFLFLFVHGILHLFGFTDHTNETQKQMERIGHSILASIQYNDSAREK